jgi:hypothetical protein
VVQVVEFLTPVLALSFLPGYGARSLISRCRGLRHTRKMLKERPIQMSYIAAVVIAMVGWLWLLFDGVAWSLGY